MYNNPAHTSPKARDPKTIGGPTQVVTMGWWPFKSKAERLRVPDVIRRDTRSWLADLQEACEMNFDSPEEARRMVRQMQGEWNDAHKDGIMDEALIEGLRVRAHRLLTGDDEEFRKWLDDLSFWKPGWRPEGSRSTEDS